MLPPSVRVIEATEAPLEFHARKSAHAKTYRYPHSIAGGAVCSPFLARYVWHYLLIRSMKMCYFDIAASFVIV